MKINILRTAFLALLLAFSAGSARASVKGDLNGDSDITVADVTILVSIILGETDDYDKYVADLNGDGDVTVADVTILVNAILNGDYSFILDDNSGEVTDDPAIRPAQMPRGTKP